MKPSELGCTNGMAPTKPGSISRKVALVQPSWHGGSRTASLYLGHCSHSSRRLTGGRRRDRIVVAGAPRCSCWLERSATRNLTQSNRKGLQAPLQHSGALLVHDGDFPRSGQTDTVPTRAFFGFCYGGDIFVTARLFQWLSQCNVSRLSSAFWSSPPPAYCSTR